jgi:hypothetical protein
MSSKIMMVALGFASVWPAALQAHDIYTFLTDEMGKSCCENTDCRPVRHRTTSSGVEMLINERWVHVPRGRIQYRILEGDSGETAGGHWCGEPYEGSYITYCAFLPPEFASLSVSGLVTSLPLKRAPVRQGDDAEQGAAFGNGP